MGVLLHANPNTWQEAQGSGIQGHTWVSVTLRLASAKWCVSKQKKNLDLSAALQAGCQWQRPVILELLRLGWEDQDFKASLAIQEILGLGKKI